MFLSEWHEFPAAPCLTRKKYLKTARVFMLLKSRASLTCFRACFLPGRGKDLSTLPYNTEFVAKYNYKTTHWHKIILVNFCFSWPPVWSSGQGIWLQIQRSRVWFPVLPDFPEWQWVWNGVHSASWASWGQLRSYLNKISSDPGSVNRD